MCIRDRVVVDQGELPALAGKSLAQRGFGLHTVPLRFDAGLAPVSYTHLRAHETPEHLVCRLLLTRLLSISYAVFCLQNQETPEHLVCRLLLEKTKN